MQSLVTLSSSSSSLLLYRKSYNYNSNNKQGGGGGIFSIKAPISHHQSSRSCRSFCRSNSPQFQYSNKHHLSSLPYNPLIITRGLTSMSIKRGRGSLGGVVCYSGSVLSPPNLHWIATISTAVLMLAKGTTIHKSFLVPLFVLHAPSTIVSWIQGEYGMWTAFLALLVRLFFHIPGELELPFITLLLVIVSPYQIMKLRGTKEGIILSLVTAVYLAFQHFTRAGSLGRAFEQGSIIATLATICIVAVPCLLFI